MLCSRTTRRWIGLLALALSACGGGGGDGAVDSAPAISNLRVSPTSALQVPGATTTVTGTIDFSDTGGNVTKLRLVTSAGGDVTVPVSAAGLGSGTLSGAMTVPNDRIGRFTFEIWLEDAAGRASNRLSGTFDVLLNDSATSWRQIPGHDALESILKATDLFGGVWTGNQYVLVGGNGTVVTSPDLVTWARQTSGVTHVLRSIAWSGSAFVAIGNNAGGDFGGEAIVLRSGDARSWAARQRAGDCAMVGDPSSQHCGTPAVLSKVIWAGSQFVAVGHETRSVEGDVALILTSPDGMTWVQQAVGKLPVGSLPVGLGDEALGGVRSVAWSGSLLVAVGQARDGSAAVWTSPDGRDWTARTPPLAGQRRCARRHLGARPLRRSRLGRRASHGDID